MVGSHHVSRRTLGGDPLRSERRDNEATIHKKEIPR
jgi:hypothetical protein